MRSENEMMRRAQATEMENETATEAASRDLLDVDEVAARLRVKKSWVYSHVNDLGVIRAGKYLRFEWATVLARLRDQEAASHIGSASQRPSLTSRN